MNRFRAARNDEADKIFALYSAVRGTPFCTWDDEYPGMTEIQNDLAGGNLFVLETDGGIIGAVSVVSGNELDALDIWHPGGKAGEFARVVIHPALQGRGLAKLLVSNVLAELKKRGCETVHIACAVQNLPAGKTYRHFGFTAAGQKELWGHLFDLLELRIQNEPNHEGDGDVS